MALSANGSLGGGRRSRRRRRGRAGLTEINVTPLVDVMLVLLIIFMVSAPLLSAGVPVDLPKTDAAALPSPDKPLTVTVEKTGALHLNDDAATLEGLVPAVQARGGSAERPIYVRADGAAPYAMVAQVMARLSTNGFTKLNLVTDVAPAPTKSDAGLR
ncbi:ExbD/TolR family protein [soil metagenome]